MNHTVAAEMRLSGGNFARNLAALWVVADSENRQKIETTWADLIAHYQEMVFAKDDAAETAE